MQITAVLKKLNVVLDSREQHMLNEYGDEEDKANRLNLWNYFEIFNKINEKSLKANKG